MFESLAELDSALDSEHTLVFLGWRGRRVAQRTRALTKSAADWVDSEVASVAHQIGHGKLVDLVEAAAARFDPEAAVVRRDESPLDVRRAKAVGLLADPRQALALLIELPDDARDARLPPR